MHVTARTRYGLRAVLAMAAVAPATISTASLAAVGDMPHGFLQNVLGDLRRARLISSQRGHDGGYRLAHPPANITVGDVIRIMDITMADHWQEAYDEPVTGDDTGLHLQRIWTAADTALRGVLDEVTLADIITGDLPAHIYTLAPNLPLTTPENLSSPS